MNKRFTSMLITTVLAGWVLATPLAASAAARSIHETRTGVADGTVEVINVAGSVDVQGSDGNQIDVSGTLGDKIERLEITQSGTTTTIRVVRPEKMLSWGDAGDAKLRIVIPRGNSLTTSLVSSDLHTEHVLGAQTLRSVSGDISGDAASDLSVSTVSGDVQLTARGSQKAAVDTTSGDTRLSGAGGEVSIKTVSGDASLDLGTVNDVSLNSVSGDLRLNASLAGDGKVKVHSVSGDIQVDFNAALDADVSARTLSGDIRNCAGPRAVDADHGPGSSLNFRSGKGSGNVNVETTSGDIAICAAH